MKKNVIKINESTLRQIVTESVKKVLNELSEPYDNGGRENITQAKTGYLIFRKSQEKYVDAIIESGDYQKLAGSAENGSWYPGKICAAADKEIALSPRMLSKYGGNNPVVYVIVADVNGCEIKKNFTEGWMYLIEPSAVINIRKIK